MCFGRVCTGASIAATYILHIMNSKRFWFDIRKKFLMDRMISAVEEISEGSDGFFFTGDFQAGAQQALLDML